VIAVIARALRVLRTRLAGTKRPQVTAERYAAMFHRAFALGDDDARPRDRLARAAPEHRARAHLRVLGDAVDAFAAAEPADPALNRFHRWPPRYFAHRHALHARHHDRFVAAVGRRDPATAARLEEEIGRHAGLLEASRQGVGEAIVGLYKRDPRAYRRLGLTTRELGAFGLRDLFSEPGAAAKRQRQTAAPVASRKGPVVEDHGRQTRFGRGRAPSRPTLERTPRRGPDHGRASNRRTDRRGVLPRAGDAGRGRLGGHLRPRRHPRGPGCGGSRSSSPATAPPSSGRARPSPRTAGRCASRGSTSSRWTSRGG
jgi:hypothetical protein